MSNNLEAGDRVTFNVGKPDGPLYKGLVTKKLRDGNVVILPERASSLGNVKFFNIKKAEEVTGAEFDTLG